MTRIGPDTIARFKVPWWWRANFTAGLRPGQVAHLIVNGVIGAASVWLNGVVTATITPPGGGTPITVSRSVDGRQVTGSCRG